MREYILKFAWTYWLHPSWEHFEWHQGCQRLHGPITSSSHVFTNPEYTKPDIFPWNLLFVLICSKWTAIKKSKWIIKCQYNCNFYWKDNLFLEKQKQLQIENSGFVKTCDENVHSNQYRHRYICWWFVPTWPSRS